MISPSDCGKDKFYQWSDPDALTKMYISVIRPHLEYAAPVWNPELTKDIRKPEILHAQNSGAYLTMIWLRVVMCQSLQVRGKYHSDFSDYNELEQLDPELCPEQFLCDEDDILERLLSLHMLKQRAISIAPGIINASIYPIWLMRGLYCPYF